MAAAADRDRPSAGIDTWYAHPFVIVLKLTQLPPDYPHAFTFPARTEPNGPYHGRGWVRAARAHSTNMCGGAHPPDATATLQCSV